MKNSSIRKASNVASVLMNPAAMKSVGISYDNNSKAKARFKMATKIVAELWDKNQTESIMKMFQQDFGCDSRCPSTTGIEANKKKGLITIDGEKVHDRETFDCVVGALMSANAMLF